MMSRRAIILIIILVLGSAVIFFSVSRMGNQGGSLTRRVQKTVEIGHEAAREWKNDAELSSVRSDVIQGRTVWTGVFASKKTPGIAYEVLIEDGRVIETKELRLAREGKAVPGNLITAEEAVAKMRKIPGFENEQVTGVELIYGPDGNTWYWGITTARGVITIKAN